MKVLLIKPTSSNENDKGIYLSLIMWFFLGVVLFSLSLVKEDVLPVYFFFDANTIATFISMSSHLTPGDSYSSTAAFYSYFDVGRHSVFFPIISSFIIISIFYIHLKDAEIELTLVGFILVAFYMMLAVIYMTLLSKDFIVLLVVSSFIYLHRAGMLGSVLWSGIAVFYAYYFRSYWFLNIALFYALYFFSFYTRRVLLVFLFSIFLLFLLSIAFSVFMGVDVDNFRTIVNDVRLDQANQNSNTMILPFISGGGLVMGWVNIVTTWVSLMIPMPLILSLSPYYLVISFMIIYLFFLFWKSVSHELKKDISVRNRVHQAAFCLTISVTLVQSVFEPDYGSYVRHLAPFYPIIFYVIYSGRRKHNESFARS